MLLKHKKTLVATLFIVIAGLIFANAFIANRNRKLKNDGDSEIFMCAKFVTYQSLLEINQDEIKSAFKKFNGKKPSDLLHLMHSNFSEHDQIALVSRLNILNADGDLIPDAWDNQLSVSIDFLKNKSLTIRSRGRDGILYTPDDIYLIISSLGVDLYSPHKRQKTGQGGQKTGGQKTGQGGQKTGQDR